MALKHFESYKKCTFSRQVHTHGKKQDSVKGAHTDAHSLTQTDPPLRGN